MVASTWVGEACRSNPHVHSYEQFETVKPIALVLAMLHLLMDMIVDALLAIASAAATLVAAYYGAKFAFDFQNSQQEKKIAKGDVSNVNIAILNLLATHHHLTQYKKHFVELNLSQPDRHFSILPISVTLPRLTADLDKIAFLINTSDPRIIHGFSLAVIDINLTVDLIAARSDFHANELQPRLEALEPQIRIAASLQEMEAMLGPRVTQTLKHLTEMMIEYLNHSLPLIETTICKLHSATKEVYPDHLVAKMTEQPNGKQI